MKPDLTLLLGSDEAYFPGLLMALLSTLQSIDANKSYHVILLDGGIEPKSYRFLEEKVEALRARRALRMTVERLPLDLGEFDGLPKIWGRSAMTYARILAPDFTDADALIWIDADMLIFRDFDRFQPTDPDRTMIAGVTDPVIKHLDGDCPIPKAERPVEEQAYVNCGLLWMNLKRMRETDFKRRTLDFMVANKEQLTYWDQTALNAMTIGEKEVLPDEYNFFCLDLPNQTVASRVGQSNFHMVSPDKPWLPEETTGHMCRDYTFWALWNLLTGESTDEQVEKIRARAKKEDLELSRKKARMYKMLLRRGRVRKWSTRYQDLKYLRQDLETQVRDALAAWYVRGERQTVSS